jgi:hypothetical protein
MCNPELRPRHVVSGGYPKGLCHGGLVSLFAEEVVNLPLSLDARLVVSSSVGLDTQIECTDCVYILGKFDRPSLFLHSVASWSLE